MLKDYLFTDLQTGEEFFVETVDLADAWDIVNREFGKRYTQKYIEFNGVYSVEEAEAIGLDTL